MEQEQVKSLAAGDMIEGKTRYDLAMENRYSFLSLFCFIYMCIFFFLLNVMPGY